MKNNAKSLLTQQEQAQVIQCVKEVEKTTSGEIVPMIVSQSYDYPRATSLCALVLGLVAAASLATLLGWTDMWSFLGLFLGTYGLCSVLIPLAPALKRPFILKREMEEEVNEAAVTNFFLHGLHRTRDLTGILIFISAYERKVWILADKGINDKVDKRVWGEVAAMVTDGIKSGAPGEALCQAIRRCGELVETNFPIKHDDTDELPNLIVDGEKQG